MSIDQAVLRISPQLQGSDMFFDNSEVSAHSAPTERVVGIAVGSINMWLLRSQVNAFVFNGTG